MFRKIIFVFFCLFFLSSLSQNFIQYRRNLDFYNNYKQEYEKAKKQNNNLKTLMVKTNDVYEMEKIIRNKLQLTQKGETVIVIPTITPNPFTPSPTSQPVYQQWLTTFFQN